MHGYVPSCSLLSEQCACKYLCWCYWPQAKPVEYQSMSKGSCRSMTCSQGKLQLCLRLETMLTLFEFSRILKLIMLRLHDHYVHVRVGLFTGIQPCEESLMKMVMSITCTTRMWHVIDLNVSLISNPIVDISFNYNL